MFPSFEDNLKSLLDQRANMEAALSDVIQFEEALGNITDKPMDSNNLVSVKVDIFEESPYFFKYLHCLNMNRAAVIYYFQKFGSLDLCKNHYSH